MNKSRLLLPLQTSIAAVSFPLLLRLFSAASHSICHLVLVKQIVGFLGGY